MKTIELNIEDVRAAYNEATDEEVKKMLRRVFGKKVIFENIMEAVKSYEDACELDGIQPLSIENFAFLPEEDREYHFAEHQYTVINRVLCEGWVPDYSNDDQIKCYPYFIWDQQAAGGPGFSSYDFTYVSSLSFVGARRVYPNADLAIYAGKQFIAIHNIIHKSNQK